MALETESVRETQRTTVVNRSTAGGSFFEGLFGLGVVVLAIIALAGAAPVILLSICTIGLGAALFFEAGTISARYNTVMAESQQKDSLATAVVVVSFAAAVAGIALGILALCGVLPWYLNPIASLAFGGALIMDSIANNRLNVYEARMGMPAGISPGTQVIIGVAAIALGIFALSGHYPITLTLISVLAVGSVIFLNGSLVGTRMMSLIRSH